jgi:hypothetical protein
MKQDLWKFIASPVASAKSSRTFLRQEATPGAALQRMRVSSAYCKTGQGVEGEMGCIKAPQLQASRNMRCSTSATMIKR